MFLPQLTKPACPPLKKHKLVALKKVTVGSLELSANKDIRQVIEIVEDFGKYNCLNRHLQVLRITKSPNSNPL